MGGEDEVVRSLLSPELIVPCVRFSAPGVSLRAGPAGDDVAIVGTLMLIRQHPNANTAFDTFLTWVPYTYLSTFAPSLLTPAARATVSADAAALPSDIKEERWEFEQRQTVCVCVANICKIQRKTNLRGRRTLIIQRAGRELPEPPLAFAEGGSTPFFDELKALVELRQLTGEGREAWSVHCPEPPQPSASDDDLNRHASANVSATEQRSSGAAATPTSGSFGDPNASGAESPAPRARGGESHVDATATNSTTADPRARAEFEKDVYGSKSSRGFMGTVMRFGKTVADKSAKAVVAVAAELNDLVAESPTTAPPGGDDNDYDIVDVSAAIPVEDLVPQLVPSPTAPRMGLPLRQHQWNGCFDADGRLNATAYAAARETAFKGGIDPAIRGEVWPFLLGVFSPSTSAEEREAIRRANHEQYHTIKLQWTSISAEQADYFSEFRDRKARVEKDVRRTDRKLPQYSSDDSPLLIALFNVLMTYAFYNFDVGYCQGMSDFLSPILLMYEEEEMSFAVFKALMATRTMGNFYNDSRHSMLKQLDSLRVLIQAFLPKLYAHFERHDALDLTFAFRWLIVYFKREFSVLQVPLLWDIIFACPFTMQYELFMTAAVLKGLTPQIEEHNLSKDEMIRFANAVNGNLKLEDLIVMTADFYDVVSSQYSWRKKTQAASTGGAARPASKEQRPSLDDIVKEYSVKAPSAAPTGKR